MGKIKDLIAKPVLSDKFWIIESGGEKIGTIQAIDDGGFTLVKNQIRKKYLTIRALGDENHIVFDKRIKSKVPKNVDPIFNYPTSSRPYNVVWNVKHKFAAYTKTKSSKCLYCAGYFAIKLNGIWKVEFCPKLIMINRYRFIGPFKTSTEAENSIQNIQ